MPDRNYPDAEWSFSIFLLAASFFLAVVAITLSFYMFNTMTSVFDCEPPSTSPIELRQ
jgi:hypothetical protein